ncbi:hypothetical protein JOF41_006724 [Saccharothrix coeruleofusca]|uniref:hypothetical protein n=1 Tax=Saccharothrix coeruleofusca TaxID=33919 RepID=UPI001AE5DA91|nr:hypothetical protein [Saccharothrix coeruleofusca]MBP2340546.1 hypothetical protein [Saccharothrix coeruleofusca]
MAEATRSQGGALAFRVLLRVVISGVVGAGLLAAWVSAYRAGALDRVVDETSLSEFLLLVVVGLPVALLVSALLAGPLLWLMRVRPVWPIVLLGPVLLGVAYFFRLAERFPGLDEWTALAVLAGLSYALAGLITTPAMLRAKR